MKYLCLCCHEESAFDSFSDDELKALMDETRDYLELLRENGKLVDSNPLQGVATAASVRVRNNNVSVTDGPFAETKEQLGGYFMVEARDFNEAIQIASRWPGARSGTVEVRPVDEDAKKAVGA